MIMADLKEETFYFVRDALRERDIPVVRGVECHYSKGWVSVNNNKFESFKLGRDIFRDRSEALAQVEFMRKKKIAKLQNRIQKLERMEFK